MNNYELEVPDEKWSLFSPKIDMYVMKNSLN